jgi:hypothetical protein
MKIEILKNCYVSGKAQKIGDVVDVKNPNVLIGMSKARLYVAPAPAKIKPKAK